MQEENNNSKRRTFALVILLIGAFMDILDTMVINIAVVLGVILCAIGIAGVELVLHGAGSSLTNWQLLPVLLIAGAGMGMLVSSLTDFSLSQIPGQDAGSASGILSMMQQLGSSIGIAILGTINLNNTICFFTSPKSTPVLNQKHSPRGINNMKRSIR
ncbi:hypothetical protein RZO55_07135 [Clostridium boliviensis]|uniref:Multidrug efflux MFS transporter n=1 Tax=Clostridium boliviensis TaxID=318465 RepID=A0ABU4GIA6_9CLOT|nr:MFS transporter [Clostridium boliviensis]MDW2797349.1 hypothetical protein [Clostridium boliviensis]